MLIAIDWGTTNFRAYLLDAKGLIADKISAPEGVTNIENFPEALHDLLKEWDHHEVPKIMSGMVGSTKGWVDVSYVECPSTIEDLAKNLHQIDESTYIVPGVNILRPGHIDVMRGEETQIFGAEHDGLFCLPGTHSKWVTVKNGNICNFSTFMSGELFQAVSTHTILSMKDIKQVEDHKTFMLGIEMAQNDRALSSLLFTARSFMLFDKIKAEHVHSYLSGLLIGAELKCALKFSADSVYLIAEPSLAELYKEGLSLFNRKGIVLNAESITVTGLFKLANMAGII